VRTLVARKYRSTSASDQRSFAKRRITDQSSSVAITSIAAAATCPTRSNRPRSRGSAPARTNGRKNGNARKAIPGGKIEHTRSFGPGAGGPPGLRFASGGTVAVDSPQARKKYDSESMR
jgi:hypothetical protein